MPELSFRRVNQRGATLVLFTLILTFVLIPMIGLAIDGGFVYYAHSRLVAAADAAALAGARSLSVGMDLSSQTANAQSIATQYIQANIPPGLLNSGSLTIPPPVVTETADHIRTVSVNPSMTVGLYFMPLLSFPTATISAYAASARRDVNIVMTLDRSGSMAGVCGIMKSDAANFVSKWTNGRDTLGLITFMGNASVDYPSTLYFKSQTPSMATVLGTLNCGGNTGSASGLSLAHQEILKVAEPGALNVIVFFTDGVPNGYLAGPPPPAQFGFQIIPGKSCNGSTAPVPGYIADGGGINSPVAQPITSTSTPSVSIKGCTPGSWSQLSSIFVGIPPTDYFGDSATLSNYSSVATDANGNITFSDANSDAVSKNAADDAARKARLDGIFVYTIGLDGDGGVDGTLLKRIANDPASAIYDKTQPTGKYYYSPNAGQLASVWNSIASEIIRISQ